MIIPKMPNAEDFARDLLVLDGPEQETHVLAAIRARDRIVLEVAAEAVDRDYTGGDAANTIRRLKELL